MTEQELRVLVRSIVADRLRGLPSPGSGPRLSNPDSGPPLSSAPGTALVVNVHPSHGRFVLAPDPEGRCIIEPGVSCNHCGFCQSYGH